MQIHTVYDCKLYIYKKTKLMSVYVKLGNINYYMIFIIYVVNPGLEKN